MEDINLKDHPYSKSTVDIANILALQSRIGNTDKDKMLPIPKDLEAAIAVTVRHVMNTVHKQADVVVSGDVKDATTPVLSMAFTGLLTYYFTEIIEGEGFETSYSAIMSKLSGVLFAGLPVALFQETMKAGAELYLQLYKAREGKGQVGEFHKQLESIVRFYIISGEDKYLDEFAPMFKSLAEVFPKLQN